jgi:hypothetical protein
MSSNCYNPFLYGWLNDAFRQQFLKMVPALAAICRGCGEHAEELRERVSIRRKQGGG